MQNTLNKQIKKLKHTDSLKENEENIIFITLLNQQTVMVRGLAWSKMREIDGWKEMMMNYYMLKWMKQKNSKKNEKDSNNINKRTDGIIGIPSREKQ